MNKTTVPILGMHCRSCELLIEDELKNIKGVKETEVNHKQACACIYYEGHLDANDVNRAIAKAGYQVGISEKPSLFSRNPQDWVDIFLAGIILFFLFILVDGLGLSKFFSSYSSQPSSLIAVLLIGVTAGFSTCMALIGGLVLGVSARFAEKHPDSSPLERFKPHLFFNAGRIFSFTIFGGVIGIIGSFFQLSGFNLGLITLAVAIVMLTLGLQLTGLFPRLNGIGFTLPKSIGRSLGIAEHKDKEYSHKNSIILGAMTFFLPCGFTQAMQILAIGSGSFTRGAAIMGMFAIGTAPGLLGIGGLTSALKGVFAQKFFKFAGVIVILLSLFNAQNGLNLMGISSQYIPFLNGNVMAVTSDTRNNIQNGVQVVKMTQSTNGYSPNVFTIVKDIPVKWVITSVDPNTCAASIIVSKYGIRKNLRSGENIIEFTPTEIGKIPFSCSMGMFTGVFNVVSNNKTGTNQTETAVQNQAAVINNADTAPPPSGSGASCGGGGCGCGGGARQAAKPAVAGETTQDGAIQVIKTIYTRDRDISPNEFTVKTGKKVRMEIDVKDNGSGCMSTITVPGLVDDPKYLAKGETIVFEFTPVSPRNYPITCAMGVPRGVIKVI